MYAYKYTNVELLAFCRGFSAPHVARDASLSGAGKEDFVVIGQQQLLHALPWRENVAEVRTDVKRGLLQSQKSPTMEQKRPTITFGMSLITNSQKSVLWNAMSAHTHTHTHTHTHAHTHYGMLFTIECQYCGTLFTTECRASKFSKVSARIHLPCKMKKLHFT